ncbi:MAG TPA: hypothetical protein LFW20_03210 [Rickettsia endosymbiont of Omalisus fontisbellaquei]|nr:hypothetical protein [Rickettsia endosymbiont of Omalisus fontisbellaquei]
MTQTNKKIVLQHRLDFTVEFDVWMPKEIVLDLPFPFLAPILGVNLPIICNKHMWFELKDNEEEQSIRDSQIIEQIGEMLEKNIYRLFQILKI